MHGHRPVHGLAELPADAERGSRERGSRARVLTSLALEHPTPTFPSPLPATTTARKDISLPPFFTVVTRRTCRSLRLSAKGELRRCPTNQPTSTRPLRNSRIGGACPHVPHTERSFLLAHVRHGSAKERRSAGARRQNLRMDHRFDSNRMVLPMWLAQRCTGRVDALKPHDDTNARQLRTSERDPWESADRYRALRLTRPTDSQ